MSIKVIKFQINETTLYNKMLKSFLLDPRRLVLWQKANAQINSALCGISDVKKRWLNMDTM